MDKYFKTSNYFNYTIDNINSALKIIANTNLNMADMQTLISNVLDANKVFTITMISKTYGVDEKLHFDADSLEDAQNKVKLHFDECDVITEYIPYPEAIHVFDFLTELMQRDDGNFTPEEKERILKAGELISKLDSRGWDTEDFETTFEFFVKDSWEKLIMATEHHFFEQEFKIDVEKIEGDELFSWLTGSFDIPSENEEKFLEALEKACGVE